MQLRRNWLAVRTNVLVTRPINAITTMTGFRPTTLDSPELAQGGDHGRGGSGRVPPLRRL